MTTYTIHWYRTVDYERDLRERQRQHLESVRGNHMMGQQCMHDMCPECIGTGVKHDGSPCVHMLSCPCPKCSPWC